MIVSLTDAVNLRGGGQMPTEQKIVCVLYDDPVGGYPPQYARREIPSLAAYPDG
jgi:hypothetical protein